jgi:hypothetical protein
MITSVEKLKEYIKLNNAPYWILYKASNSSEKVSEVDHGNLNLSMSDSLARLDEVFKVIGAGRYLIKAKTKPNDIKAGVYTEQIDISASEAGIGSLGVMPGHGFMTKADVAEAISAEKAKWDNELKISKLQEEINSLKKQGPLEKMIAAATPALEPILIKGLAKIAGIDLSEQQAQPAYVGTLGFEQAQPEQATMEEIERIQAALEKLDAFLSPKGYKVVEVLEKLANATETKPDTILIALKML